MATVAEQRPYLVQFLGGGRRVQAQPHGPRTAGAATRPRRATAAPRPAPACRAARAGRAGGAAAARCTARPSRSAATAADRGRAGGRAPGPPSRRRWSARPSAAAECAAAAGRGARRPTPWTRRPVPRGCPGKTPPPPAAHRPPSRTCTGRRRTGPRPRPPRTLRPRRRPGGRQVGHEGSCVNGFSHLPASTSKPNVPRACGSWRASHDRARAFHASRTTDKRRIRVRLAPPRRPSRSSFTSNSPQGLSPFMAFLHPSLMSYLFLTAGRPTT